MSIDIFQLRYKFKKSDFRGVRTFCTFFRRKSTHKTNMSKPDMDSIFTEIITNVQKTKFHAVNLLCYWKNTDASILIYKVRRENWFQYVRRVCATAINFPRISTLISTIWRYNNKCFNFIYSHTYITWQKWLT